jgi:subtilisin-like proprotein convertase family protein
MLFAGESMKKVLIVFAFSLFILSNHAQSSKAPQTVYSNPASITINTNPASVYPKAASLYPSTINVSGMTGTITNLKVTLKGTTNFNNTVDMLLVSPSGVKFIVQSDAVVLSNNSDVVLTFEDSAATILPNGNGLGTNPNFRPTNYTFNPNPVDTFPAPAPPPPYLSPAQAGSATLASAFNGTDPNGNWQLFVSQGSNGFNSFGINSGWSLTITTNGLPIVFSNSSYIASTDDDAQATPYGSNINVSGSTGIISKVKVSLNGLTHSSAFDIGALLVSPNGTAVSLISVLNNGSQPANSVNLTFDDSAANELPFGGFSSGTYRTTNTFLSYFSNPAPLAPFNFQLSSLNGMNPNGDWKLFIIDSRGDTNSGVIANGWSLDITTVPNVVQSAGCFVPFFDQAVNYPAGGNPTNLAVGDFNNDNKQDFVVTNQVSSNVSILLGSGTGTFTSGATLTAGANPYSVAVGRFNADANDDLVVVNSNSNNVSVFLGNGNGTFSAATNVAVGASPISVAVGDFNSDNKRDIAVANFGGFFSGTVTILLGNGTGGFTLARDLRARTQPSFVSVGRFNNDSIDDLAVTNFGSDNVSVYIGFGNGNFSTQANYTVGFGPVSLAIFDANNDSFQDIFTANYNGDGFSQLGGTSTGVFTANNSLPGNAGSNPVSLAAGDFVGGNSIPQIAIALNGADKVVFANTNSSSPNEYSVGVYPNSIVKGDFNGDGRIDLATANSGSNNVSVLLNSCKVAKGNLFDSDGDRKTDYSVFRPSSLVWYTDLNAVDIYIRSRRGDLLVPADYNGDGKTDYGIYRPESGLWQTSTSPNFQGSPLHFVSFGIAVDVPVPGDFDGDGKADIAVWRPTNGTFYIRTSSNNGFVAFSFGSAGDVPVPSDFDGDGKFDYAVFRPSTGIWYIWYSQTNSFGAFQFGATGDKLVPADYDGDGKTDLAVFRAGIWYVLRSSNGSFYGSQFGLATDIPAPGDYDGDSKFDQAVYRDGVFYVLNSSNGQLQAAFFGATGDFPLPASYVR